MAVVRWLSRIVGGLLLLMVFIAGARFASLNAETVSLDLFVASTRMSLAAALLIAFVCGMVVGYVGSLATAWGQLRKARKARRERQALQKEVTNLRKLPVREPG